MAQVRSCFTRIFYKGSRRPKAGIHQHRCHDHKPVGLESPSSSSVPVNILVLLLLLCRVPCGLSCTPSERGTLLAFLSNLTSTPPPKGATLPSWDAGRDPDCCRWDGVACDGGALGSVTRLWLPRRGLKGRLSGDALLRGLPSLTHLNLSGNSLRGVLEPALLWSPALVVLDVSFNRLEGQVGLAAGQQLPQRLQVLDVSSNLLTGPLLLPTWWAGAPDLVGVNASYNEFTGSIPPSVCAVATRLQALDLSFNELSGGVPPGFGNCSQLRALRIGYNNLSGPLPPDLYRAAALRALSAPSNGISGGLDAIGNLANLSLLDLSSNNLTGPVPEGIGRLANLEKLMLIDNQLSGTLPPALGGCTRLRSLSLRNNKLTGQLSAVDFSKLAGLKSLDLAFNNFTGTLPATLYSCRSLVALRIANNSLSGRIEPEIAKLEALSFVSLSFNRLTDVDQTLKILQGLKNLTTLLLTRNFLEEPMPQGGLSLTGFQNLRALSLARCRFRGQVPRWLSSLSKLQFLDLSKNQLTGAIPGWLGSLPGLFYLDLSENLLSGEFPVELAALRMLSSERAISQMNQSFELPFFINTVQHNLSLQYNQLSNLPALLNLQNNSLAGAIPPEIGRLKMVQVLNLSRNGFSGTIPPQIGSLTRLEILDLSSNRLTGPIPSELSRLHFLSKFNVAHNDLSGRIPDGGQFGTFNFSSFEGNPGLCGQNMAPLRPCNDTGFEVAPRPSSRPGAPKHTTNKKLLLGVILGTCFGAAVVLVLLALLMLYSRRTKQAVEPVYPIEGGATSNRAMPCFPRDHELAACGPVVLFPGNCQVQSLTIVEILQATNSFDDQNIIGCGAFGLVYRCALPNGTQLAIKRLIGDTGIMEREFKAEVEALSTARHANLVSLQGYFLHKDFRLLIYSLMENGSLDYWLHEKPDGPAALSWPVRLRIAQGASQGLFYIHQTCKPHIVHRDIKSSNILLDHGLRAHLADFGLSRLMLPTNTHVTTELVGTLGYIPPEYGQAWMATLRGDIYSFGVVLLELLTGRRPYLPFDPKQSRELVGWVHQMRNQGKEEDIFDPLLRGHGSPEQMLRVLHIACLCVNLNPVRRPVIQEVVDWLHHVDTPTDEPNS